MVITTELSLLNSDLGPRFFQPLPGWGDYSVPQHLLQAQQNGQSMRFEAAIPVALQVFLYAAWSFLLTPVSYPVLSS